MNRSVYVVVAVLFAVISFSLTGCGPSKEESTVMDHLNNHPELIKKGGYVKKLDRFEGQDGKVFRVEAEIVDKEGVAIGRLRSERVEGFGTSKPRIQWYETPGVSEEWKEPERGQGRRGQRRPGGDQRRQNQEEKQPAAQ